MHICTRTIPKLAVIVALALAASGIGLAGGQATPALADPADAQAAAQQVPEKATAPAKPGKKQLRAFKKASADFSLELFQRCVKASGKDSNVTIAPMSVMNALAITANGAKGPTARQMRAVLGEGASMARINKNLAWYNGKLSNSKKARLRTANAIWYHDDDTLTMKARFLAATKKYYAARVSPADFSSPATVDQVNSWVSEQTNGMIPRIVDSLDPRDRILIANALYFDAKWMAPFNHSSTAKKTFTAANGSKHKVKMMHGTEHRYIEGKNVTGFTKPYAKGYTYVALLPKKGMSLKKYVAGLDGDTFRKLVGGAKDATVRIALPKYTIEYSNDKLQAQLVAMGMKLPFSGKANFAAMAKSTAGKLRIGRVMHKTKIEVDEEGTKAAAATAVMLAAGASLDQDVKTVTLNRPFVYAIVDNATKLPVFIGTVNDIR